MKYKASSFPFFIAFLLLIKIIVISVILLQTPQHIASAQTSTDETNDKKQEQERVAPKIDSDTEKTEEPQSPKGPVEDISELLKGIRERDAALKKREEQLNLREASLSALQSQIDSKLEDFKKVKNDIQNLLTQYLDQKQTRYGQTIAHLVAVYSSMDPKAAAKSLEKLETGLAVDILAKPENAKCSEIL